MRGRNNSGRGRYNNGNGNGNGRRGRRSGNYRSGGRGGNGKWKNRGRGGYNNRNRGHRSSSSSGNLRERITVESGHLVIIDQFMLANPQFQEQLQELIDADPVQKNDLIAKYGGMVLEVGTGNYRILRNPYSCKIVIHSAEHEDVDFEEVIANAGETIGCINIDTRCLAMIDRELLDDIDLLEKYQDLWFAEKDKACRDLLRDNGGAVRYGFEKFGDELSVYFLPDENTICLAAQNVPEQKEDSSAEDLENEELSEDSDDEASSATA